MVEKRKFPKWLKVILIIFGIIAFIFASFWIYGIYLYFFDVEGGLCRGMRQADSYLETTCFDKQYLSDFKSDYSSFLSNKDSYAVSVYKVEMRVDKTRCSRDHNITVNSYFAIREDGELKEVPQDDVDIFLDSYCEDCLVCYSLDSFEPLFEENWSSIWDYKTEGYYCMIDDFGKWYCIDEPVPRINNKFLKNHTIEGVTLN